MPRILAVLLLLTTLATALSADPPRAKPVQIVGHRGLFHQAPENTLAGFAGCFQLRLGGELDIRRCKDGHLVCVHDDTLERTTTAKGKVADFTLAELKQLDAGLRFSPEFQGERIPTLAEVFTILKQQPALCLLALDFKEDDAKMIDEVVQLAKQAQVLDRVVCIGLTITDAKFRQRLKAAERTIPVARLVVDNTEFASALTDADCDWVYLRFLPTTEQVKQAHLAKKRVFLAGTKVSGNEPDNWRQALLAGVDALLTDYPLECRQVERGLRKP